MPFGEVGGFSEVVYWKIPDFFSLSPDTVYIESPAFALAGCRWHIVVYPKGYEMPLEYQYGRGYVSVYLSMDDPKITAKTVNYSFGLRRPDGSLEEELSFPRSTFKKGQLLMGDRRCWSLDFLRKHESVVMPSGTLTVNLRVEDEARTAEVFVPDPREMETQQRMLVDLETLSSDFKDLFISERKCDVTVNVQGKDFKAHRAVLSARSSVFRAMYDHDTAEEETGALKIPDCDPGTFGEFLNYLYTGKTEEMSFQTAYHLYITADKYDVQRLKSFCADNLIQNLKSENVCEVVVLADRYSDEELMSSTQVFFNNNYCKILLTSEWNSFLSTNLRLSKKLLIEMASAVSKSV